MKVTFAHDTVRSRSRRSSAGCDANPNLAILTMPSHNRCVLVSLNVHVGDFIQTCCELERPHSRFAALGRCPLAGVRSP